MHPVHVNVNLLRYFSEPARLDDEAKTFLQRGMIFAMEWAVQGLVVPHVGRTIDSTVEAINAGLQSLKTGTGTLGKLVVIVDRDLVESWRSGICNSGCQEDSAATEALFVECFKRVL